MSGVGASDINARAKAKQGGRKAGDSLGRRSVVRMRNAW